MTKKGNKTEIGVSLDRETIINSDCVDRKTKELKSKIHEKYEELVEELKSQVCDQDWWSTVEYHMGEKGNGYMIDSYLRDLDEGKKFSRVFPDSSYMFTYHDDDKSSINENKYLDLGEPYPYDMYLECFPEEDDDDFSGTPIRDYWKSYETHNELFELFRKYHDLIQETLVTKEVV